MILRFGSYSHADNECMLAIRKDGMFDDRGLLYAIRERWDVQGTVVAASSSALTTALTALDAAYYRGNKDFGLYESGGSATAHILRTAQCIGGTRVVQPPSYPRGDGAEYVTFRTFALAVEGDVRIANSSPLLSFRETVSVTGTGGPRNVLLEARSGTPQAQQTSQRTIVYASQEGEAVGRDGYPAIPGPLWPQWEAVHERKRVLVAPRRTGDGFTDFTVQWSYVFLSAEPLFGLPTIQ